MSAMPWIKPVRNALWAAALALAAMSVAGNPPGRRPRLRKTTTSKITF